MALELRRFSNSDLPAINVALLERSLLLQQQFPGLPSAKGHDLAEKLRDGVGAVALKGDVIVGVLVGHVDGHVAKVPLSGCLTESHAMVDALYCAAAPLFVDQGAITHEIYAPAMSPYEEAFRDLGFGWSATQFMIATPRFHVEAPQRDVVVRLATSSDEDARLAIEREFIAHVNAPPSFSAMGIDEESEIRQELRDSLERKDFEIFVAELDGEVVGELLLFDRPLDGERIPPSSVDLAFCAVREAVRSQGVGTALARHTATRAADRGVHWVTMDVRTTNRRASTFWHRFGFTPVISRVERTLATPRS